MKSIINNEISFNKLLKLKSSIKETDISEIAYKFYSKANKDTSIRISTDDGQTVLIKSSSNNFLEQDWQLLNNIAKDYFDKYKVKQNVEIKKEVINYNDNNYYTFREIIDAGICQISPGENLILVGDAAKLYHKIDAIFLEFAKQENSIDFYSDPFWLSSNLHKIGYTQESSYLCKFSETDKSKVIDYWQVAVCDNVWKSLENRMVSHSMSYTTKGVCCRNEGSQEFLFERMRAFTMREVVFIGCKEDVYAFQERAIKFLKQLMGKLLLNGNLEDANDPFFLTAENKEQIQNYELPEVIKQELRLNIYGGRSIAAASCNIHGNFFTKSLNIKHSQDNILWTSCIAFGIERWIWCILIQFGPDSQHWPDELKNLIKS